MKKFLLNTLYILRTLLDPFVHFREVSILCYHSISDDQADTAVSKDQFEKHLFGLKRDGYAFVSLDEIFAWLSQNTPMSRKAVAVTFDDGYADFKTTALPILEKYNIPTTLFVVGDRERYRLSLGTDLAMLSNVDVVEIEKHPLVSLGWHTKTHPNLSTISSEEVVQEITPLAPMKFFAYPGGNYSENAIDAVQNAGFSAAFSIKRDLVICDKNRWFVPRMVILRNDSSSSVLQYVSMAQHWYAALRAMLR